jgi:signal transduction histidine kinase
MTWRPYNVVDTNTNPRVYPDPFLEASGIRHACCVPIQFRDNAEGAIVLYRKESTSFTTNDLSRAEIYARLVPLLYQAIQDQASFRLIRGVDQVLQRLQREETPSPLDGARKAATYICQHLKHTFQCIEASLFLSDLDSRDQSYRVIATTWPYRQEFPETYTMSDKGITSWVLRHGKSIRIFDLAKFKRDLAFYQRTYHGIEWTDSLKIRDGVSRYLSISNEADLPPFSLMAAPLLVGRRVLGVVRCCTILDGPAYFAERELALLETVATRFAQYWIGLITHHQLFTENERWHDLVGRIVTTNKSIRAHLDSDRPDEKNILSEIEKFAAELETNTQYDTGALVSTHSKTADSLLLEQLNLYKNLVQTLSRLGYAEAEVIKGIRAQHQIFLDLGHQLKTPVLQACSYLQNLQPGMRSDELVAGFRAVRGLLRKAKRVVLTTAVYAKLARNEPLEMGVAEYRVVDLVKPLIEAALDYEAILNPRRRVRFDIDRLAFERMNGTMFAADWDLLEQAISNLFDNAGKYSFEDTSVLVTASMIRDRLWISVCNRGIPIRADESQFCVMREWRSREARRSSSEGSGIGLWLVDNIMKAQSGELVVMPTTKGGLTEIKLGFKICP